MSLCIIPPLSSLPSNNQATKNITLLVVLLGAVGFKGENSVLGTEYLRGLLLVFYPLEIIIKYPVFNMRTRMKSILHYNS